jgi:hypothetical protein
MKLKRLMFVLASVIFLSWNTRAADSTGFSFESKPGDKYPANSWLFDLYSSVSIVDSKGSDDFRLGMGFGGNYFFTRNLGAGVEVPLRQFELPEEIDASFYLRYPLNDTPWAPYGFAGFGRQYKGNAQWKSYVGAGVEYRWNPNTGVFTDIRGTFPETTGDYAMIRAGLRLGF